MWRGSSFSVVTHLFWIDSHAVSWLWWALWKTYECQQSYTDTFGLPEGARRSFISELELGSRHFTLSKGARREHDTAREPVDLVITHSWSISNKCCQDHFFPSLFPSSLGIGSIFLALFCLFPPSCTGSCCRLRVTVADKEDCLDFFKCLTFAGKKERKRSNFQVFRVGGSSCLCVFVLVNELLEQCLLNSVNVKNWCECSEADRLL